MERRRPISLRRIHVGALIQQRANGRLVPGHDRVG